MAAANESKVSKSFTQKSSSLPFGQDVPLPSISGPTYLTAQTLIQQVAYTLSDKIFSYSPETFDLDVAVRSWHEQKENNAYGYATGYCSMETRTGAGNIALGYMFSKDFDLKKRHIPQSIVASSSSLNQLRPAFDQLSLLYNVANPVVAHVAAVDYAGSGLVSDYTTALTLAEELGFGLVSSASAFEIQHISLFATLLATVLPTIHTYDGINVGRETTRIIDVLDRAGLYNNYNAIAPSVSGVEKKHSDNEGRVVKLLKAFNDELGTDYKLFEYHGDKNAESVFVVFGTIEASLAAQIVDGLSNEGAKVGLVNVRVYRPFVEEEFIAALPQSVKKVFVLGQVKEEGSVLDADAHSQLYSDVLVAINYSVKPTQAPSVTDLKYSRAQIWTPQSLTKTFQNALGFPESRVMLSLADKGAHQYSFWDSAESPAVHAPTSLAQVLSKDSSNNISLRSGHDNLVQGGVVRTDIRVSSKSIEAAYSIDSADAAYVGDEKLLTEFDIVENIKTQGVLVVRLANVKDEDLEKKIHVQARKAIFSKEIQLFVLDPTASAAVAENGELESFIAQLAFVKATKGDQFTDLSKKLALSQTVGDKLDAISADLDQALRRVEVPESWATIEPEVEIIPQPTDINVNSFVPFERLELEEPSTLKSWVSAAKGLAFKEAYGTKSALRPDLGVKTFTVQVKERRRLTPLTYDRNIFHIEFDLGDSGLKYAIGEALGIHAENDKEEVEKFIKWYGLNADDIVEVASRESPEVLENRTVYQALLQNIDIFGRPPKRFYEALAEFATDEEQKKSLLTLTIPDGATEFKRRAEVDTVTFADILAEFPSAHPDFQDLVRIVSPMKRREYSIASSQRVQPNSVSLLIVTVGWVDPSGRDRFGQATRYLNSLRVGSPLTVSVKPSVMKLPSKTTAPIIMAGLGTGLAPFRAFVQERALQRQEGHEIGPVMLYMGSRTQREEYLYGEEWEAYQDAGIITLLGRAFSRDQPQKIYIQDRMRQTLPDIQDAYLRKEGSFYLCGPTWPVPDVQAVLEEAIVSEAKAEGKTKVNSRREIETLKDGGRYVLEVY